MRLFLSIFLIVLSNSLSAQGGITYPYNPDSNGDEFITIDDFIETLVVFGSPYTPPEIQVDGVNLSEIILQMQASIEILENTISELESENAIQSALIYDLQESNNLIPGLDNYLSVDEENNTILINGANLQVVSGSGATDGEVNGIGNIIIGYDEEDDNDKSGSHNLVVGNHHTYSSYGGIVVGSNNNITGSYASVTGGYGNTASGLYSSVSGGGYNLAWGNQASVSGGDGNIAEGFRSSVSGGRDNQTEGSYSSVSGGRTNTAEGIDSSISGGVYNTSSSFQSSILGGGYNQASGILSTVAGGTYNTASGDRSSVSGGSSNNASGWHTCVSGDADNTFLDNSDDGNTIE